MLKKLFKRPGWQNKDPDIRRRSIAQLQAEELGTVLPELARSDPSAAVRARAAQRLTSLDLLKELQETDTDAAVREQAGARVRALLAGGVAEGISLDIRVEATRTLNDERLAEHLVRHADDASVRKAALAHVSHQGILAEVVIGDSEAELRKLALDKVERESTLARIAESTRKHDKRIHRQASERLEALRFARGDAVIVRERHAALCQRLEQEIWSGSGAFPAAKLSSFIAEWKALHQPAEAPLAQRFERACAQARNRNQAPDRSDRDNTEEELQQLCDALQRLHDQLEDSKRISAQNIEAHRGTLETLVAQGRNLTANAGDALVERFNSLHQDVEARLESLAANTGTPRELAQAHRLLDAQQVNERAIDRLEQSWKTAAEQNPAAYQRHKTSFRDLLGQLRKQAADAREQQEATRQRCQDLLARTEELLESGDLHDARAAHREAYRLIREHRFRGAPEQQARELNTRLREMQGWQHWANEKQRVQMCEEAEQLPDVGLDPTELARRIKDLRDRWDKLEEAEKLPGDEHHAAGPRLWRRFHSASHRAYAPCAKYFKERARERNQKLDDLRRLCDRLEAFTAETAADDLRQMEDAVRQAARGLGQVGQLDPRARGSMARRLREVLGKLNERLAGPREQNRQHKQALITRAKGLHHIKNLEEATRKVRELEKEWRNIGPTDRDNEQLLQKEFREACHVILGQEAEQSAEAARERRAKQKQLIALCESIEKLAKARGDELLSGEARIWQAQTEWDELDYSDRSLESRFHKACDTLRARLRRHQLEQRELELALLENKAQLCIRMETTSGVPAEAILADWGDLPALRDEALDKRINARFDSARQPVEGAAEGTADNLAAARKLCLRLEILAEIDSPADMQQARMDYRVAQLSNALAGGQDTVDPDTDAWNIRRDFCLSGRLPDDERDAVLERFQRALQAVNRAMQRPAQKATETRHAR